MDAEGNTVTTADVGRRSLMLLAELVDGVIRSFSALWLHRWCRLLGGWQGAEKVCWPSLQLGATRLEVFGYGVH